MTRTTAVLRRSVAWALVSASLCLSTGCATLAHRSSVSGERVRTTSDCSGSGDTCPWLIGDALLLLPGIVPGVIAFVVDFGTGAWRHDSYAETARPGGDVAVASAQEHNH